MGPNMVKALFRFTADSDSSSGYLLDLEGPGGKKLVLCIRQRRPDYLELDVREYTVTAQTDRSHQRPLVAREIYALRDLLGAEVNNAGGG